MKVLVFEWLVGGGLIGEAPLRPADPMLIQGASMFAAVVDDCLKMGCDVVALLDPRATDSVEKRLSIEQHRSDRQNNLHWVEVAPAMDVRALLIEHAAEVDYVMLIAPESDGILCRCLSWLSDCSEKLVCGPVDWVRRFADKNLTQNFLQSHAIGVPRGRAVASSSFAHAPSNFELGELKFPVVIKSADGAGADGVFICHDQQALHSFVDSVPMTCSDWRMEQYVQGDAVSVSLLQTDCSSMLLPPTGQLLSHQHAIDDSVTPQLKSLQAVGHYSGAQYPLPVDLERRATALAGQVTAAVPQWRGYLGIDMVLGRDGNDVVIEINPRMTMSYVHLRNEINVNAMKFLLS